MRQKYFYFYKRVELFASILALHTLLHLVEIYSRCSSKKIRSPICVKVCENVSNARN